MACYLYKGKKYTQEELITAIKEENSFGKWQYEIFDDKLKIEATDPKEIWNELFAKQEAKGALLNLSEIVSDELSKAYPQLKDVKVQLSNGEDDSIAFYANRGLAGKVLNLANIYNYNGVSEGTTQSIIIHEVQHAIQDIEGFSSGANAMLFSLADNISNKEGIYDLLKNAKNVDELNRIVRRSFTEIGYKDREYLNKLFLGLNNFKKFMDVINLFKDWNDTISSFEKYRRVIGEVQARNVQRRLYYSEKVRRNILLEDTEDIRREDQMFLNLSSSSFIAKNKNNLKYKTPQGKVFNSYAEALKNTQEGQIEVGANTVDGFKSLFTLDSNTNIDTPEGLVNNLIKSDFLTGNKDGNILETKGNSDVKKAVTAEMTANFIQNKFGKRAAKVTEDFNVEIDPNRINRQVKLTKANGEVEFINLDDLKNKSFNQLRREYGDEAASEIVAQDEFRKEFNSNSRQKQNTEQEYTPENVLQEKLVQLLKDMGIKTLSYVDYATKYAMKNGINPSSTALADLANQVIAFKDGIITEDDLLEETSHFIIAATPKEKLENLLRNVHKTKEWAEYSAQYMEIYKDEALVREEILGKVLANSLQERFQARNSNETENSIIAKLAELFSEFFDRIANFFNPSFQSRLDSYTGEVYKNLMRDELSDKLDKNAFGNRENVLYSIDNASATSMGLYVKSKQLLERLINQQYQLSKQYSNISDKKLLQRAKEILSVKESEVSEAEKLKAISSIVMVASSQAQLLSKAVEGKDGTGYHFTQEESIVYQNLQKRVIPLLEDMQRILGNSKQEQLLSSEIDKTVSKFKEVGKGIPTNQNIAFNRIVDRVITKLDLDITRQPDGTYTGSDAFFGEQIYNALTTAQKDTDFFHAHLGSLLAAANPLLNLAGDIIERKALDSSQYFQQASKGLINGLSKIGFDFLKLGNVVKNGYIENERNPELIKKADLEDKTEAYNKALNTLNSNESKATVDTIETVLDNLKTKTTVEDRILREAYQKNWEQIKKARYETYLSEDFIKQLNSFEIDLGDIGSISRKDLPTEALDLDAQFRRESTQIKINAGDNLTKLDQARIQEINKRRLFAKNPRTLDGEFKPGLTEVYNEEKGRYIVERTDEFDNLSAEDKAEANVAYGLNMIDLINQEFYKGQGDKGGIPNKFFEALDAAEDQVEFLSNNSYIGYPQDFWDNFKTNSGLVARLRAVGTEEADDIAGSIRRQQAIINNILKQNTVYNRPSETNFSDMKKLHMAQVKEASSLLETFYEQAKRILPAQEVENQITADNTVNDAYQKAIEDLEIKTAKEELDFILEHVTSKSRDSIIAAKEVARGDRNVPKHLAQYFKEGVSGEQAVLAYAKTKLLPYFKRTEPVGFTKAWNDFRNGNISAREFIAMEDMVNITPNFSFYENTDNVNPKWLANNKAGKEQFTEAYLKRVRDNAFFDKYKIVNGVATQNVKDWQARELLLQYQKEMIEFNGLTGVQDLYMMPQVRRTTVEKVASTTVKGLKEIIKDITTFRPEDVELGETVDGSVAKIGSQLLTIPTYYNRPLDDPKELTNNVLYAYLLYGKAASEHRARRENISDMLVLSDTMKASEFADKESDRTNAFKMLQSQIDYNFYGVKETFKANYRGVDLAKTARGINSFFKSTALAGAGVPITSYLTANTKQSIELLVGQVINKNAVVNGRKLFYKHAKGAAAEVGGFKSDSFFNVIGESLNVYNALNRYENSKYSRTGRIALEGGGNLHSAANFGPIGMTMATVISDLRIVDGKIIDYNQFKKGFTAKGLKGNASEEWVKNELFSPYMELAIKDGVLDFNNDTFKKAIESKLKLPQGQTFEEYMKYKREYLSQRILSTIQRVDSQIPEQQKSIWARNSGANFFLSFLNFLLVQTSLKFKKKQFNISEGEVQVGNYRETWEFLVDNFRDPKNIYENYKKAGPETKLALRRTLIELAVVNALAIAALALSKYVDDEDEVPYPVALADYFLQRVALETLGSTFALPATVAGVVENPLLIYSKGKDWLAVENLFNGNADKYALKVLPYAKDIKKIYDPTTARQSYLHFQEQNAAISDIYDRFAWFTNILPEVMQGEKE